MESKEGVGGWMERPRPLFVVVGLSGKLADIFSMEGRKRILNRLL
jgi:hypothetical protein